MNVDFSVFFVIALAVTALILLLDGGMRLMRRQSGAAESRASPPWLVAQARSLFPVILIVLLVRSFIAEPFRIPSASMMPGLVDGDFIFVNKFSYGLRLPILNTKILAIGEPKRGDVVVFRLPTNPSIDFIKRLVGLPGDHIVVRDNHVYINGRPAPLRPDGVYTGGFGFTGAPLGLERFGDEEHVVMFARGRATDFEATVPAGHYFFMGDNRNDSEDSRFMDVVGFVPERNLVGHAMRIWMNWRAGSVDWHRVGKKIS